MIFFIGSANLNLFWNFLKLFFHDSDQILRMILLQKKWSDKEIRVPEYAFCILCLTTAKSTFSPFFYDFLQIFLVLQKNLSCNFGFFVTILRHFSSYVLLRSVIQSSREISILDFYRSLVYFYYEFWSILGHFFKIFLIFLKIF